MRGEDAGGEGGRDACTFMTTETMMKRTSVTITERYTNRGEWNEELPTRANPTSAMHTRTAGHTSLSGPPAGGGGGESGGATDEPTRRWAADMLASQASSLSMDRQGREQVANAALPRHAASSSHAVDATEVKPWNAAVDRGVATSAGPALRSHTPLRLPLITYTRSGEKSEKRRKSAVQRARTRSSTRSIHAMVHIDRPSAFVTMAVRFRSRSRRSMLVFFPTWRQRLTCHMYMYR